MKSEKIREKFQWFSEGQNEECLPNKFANLRNKDHTRAAPRALIQVQRRTFLLSFNMLP